MRDSETGLDYFGARYYSPALGRWLAADILSEKYPSLSSYNYSSNNSINNFDLDGRAIYRAKEGYIYGVRARELTLSTMDASLKGESAEIDFVAKSNTFIDLWDNIRTLGGSYTHATFNPNIISFGDRITHSSQIGSQTFPEITVNTQYSFQKISSFNIDIRIATNSNSDIVQLVFSNEAGQDVITYTNTIATIQKILKKSGKKAVKMVTGVKTKTITVKDKKGNIIDQKTIVEETYIYIYVIKEAVEYEE